MQKYPSRCPEALQYFLEPRHCVVWNPGGFDINEVDMHAHRKPGAPAKTTQKHNLQPKKAKIPPCTFEKEAGTCFKGVHLVHLPSEVHLSCLRSPRSPHPIRHLRSTTSDVRTSQAHTNRTQRSASLPPLSACAWARAFAGRSCGIVGANATRAYPSGSQSRIFSDGFQVRAILKASSNTSCVLM